jgi:hypothetical protein
MEEKAFNKPIDSAYDLFIRMLNNKLIEEYFQDKTFYHKSTKEEYSILRYEKSLDYFEPIIVIKNIKDNKIKRVKLKELDNLYEILIEPESKTTLE